MTKEEILIKVKSESKAYELGMERTAFLEGADTVLREYNELAKHEAMAYANWLCNTVIAGRTATKLYNDYISECGF